MNGIENIIDKIGFHGPIILGLWSIYLLKNQFTYLMAYVVGFMVNTKINEALKILIKQPRPKGCEEEFGKDTAHHYGMPSGHAQMAFFSIAFIYLTTKNQIVFLWMCLLGSITLYQRYNRKCHSIPQLVMGAVTGSIISMSIYWITKYVCKNGICRIKI